MATVQADFRDREHILFSARGRTFANSREQIVNELIGYSSMELLLIALGNCTLGVLGNHELLKNVDISKFRATLESQGSQNPARMSSIKVVVEIDHDDPSIKAHETTLERVASSCPVGNTLKFSPEIEVELRLSPVAT